jgi:transposase-like protein
MFNRTRLASFFTSKTVDTMFTAVEALASEDKKECQAGVDSEIESMLDEIKATEKVEEISAAKDLFKNTLDGDDAIKAKRRMARRASEARVLAGWLVAKMNGTPSDRCEAYRKASSMRVTASEIESDLAQLTKRAGLDLLRCETNENGKVTKTKASPAPAMALEALRQARRAYSKFCEMAAALEHKTAKAA